ncbi:MAG: hypothetical protein J6T10_25925 [Methanobrevibacter sp.]|nr:hypothetical protein [Methanobrevibacter sp.]
MKKITTLITQLSEYAIVYLKDYKRYGAIDTKYITDGKLNTQLNGLQMHLRETLDDVIEEVKQADDIKVIMKTQNVDSIAAMKIYYGL